MPLAKSARMARLRATLVAKGGISTVAATGGNRKGDGKAAFAMPEIPDKLYFRIGEVARLLDLPPYVLRFWESEFPQLKPNKGGTGQRLYRRRDVETALQIRHLLYQEGYTIPGARQYLKSDARPEPRRPEPLRPEPKPEPVVSPTARLRRLQAELRELQGLLEKPAPGTPVRRIPNPAHRGLHMAARRKPASETPQMMFSLDPTTES